MAQAPLIRHRAQGYAPRPGGGFINAEPLSMTQPYAAGSLCSTVNDLAAWTLALSNGKVVSPASYKLMTTPGTLNDGKPLKRRERFADPSDLEHRVAVNGPPIVGAEVSVGDHASARGFDDSYDDADTLVLLSMRRASIA